jgi:hypothetical protein
LTRRTRAKSKYLIQATLQLDISQHGQRLSEAAAHEQELARALSAVVNGLLTRDPGARDALWRAGGGDGDFTGTMSFSVHSASDQ